MKKFILLILVTPLLFGASCVFKNNTNNNTNSLNQAEESSFIEVPLAVQQQFDSWGQFHPEMKFCQGSEANIYVVSYVNLQSQTYYYDESGVLLDKYSAGDLVLDNKGVVSNPPIDLNKYNCQIIR